MSSRVAQPACRNCFKSFKTQQMLRMHVELGAARKGGCRIKTVDELQKENESLEKAIVIEDDDEDPPISNLSAVDNITMTVVHQKSKSMLAELDGKTVELSDEKYSELSAKLSFDYGSVAPPAPRLRPSGPAFKAPRPVALARPRRRKAVAGALTGQPCFYCEVEEPDWASLALHYVRQHWEEVRRRQAGQGPRSKFHLPGGLGMQEDRAPVAYTGPVARPTATARRHQAGLAAAEQAQRGLGKPRPEPAWMQRLDAARPRTGQPVRPHYAEAMQRYRGNSSAANQKMAAARAGQQACALCGLAFKSFNALFRHKSKVHGTRAAASSLARKIQSDGPILIED